MAVARRRRHTRRRRTIEIIDSPVYDSPLTQGLFDRATGAVWAVDASAAVVPGDEPPTFAKDLPQAEWEGVLSGLGIAAKALPGDAIATGTRGG
jgi:hypothetical protein